MAKKVRVVTDGSDPLEAAALLLGKDPKDLEHLRKFDTVEKIDAELERRKAQRKNAG